jgi:hypothetical protein
MGRDMHSVGSGGRSYARICGETLKTKKVITVLTDHVLASNNYYSEKRTSYFTVIELQCQLILPTDVNAHMSLCIENQYRDIYTNSEMHQTETKEPLLCNVND